MAKMNSGDDAAFPNDGKWIGCKPERGMTMRQYYKAAALTGTISQPDYRICPANRIQDPESWRKELGEEDVKYAAMIADAMIAEDEEHARRN